MSKQIGSRDPQFLKVMESAAHLQRLVPGAVLVGGTADHRESREFDSSPIHSPPTDR